MYIPLLIAIMLTPGTFFLLIEARMSGSKVGMAAAGLAFVATTTYVVVTVISGWPTTWKVIGGLLLVAAALLITISDWWTGRRDDRIDTVLD